MADARADDEKVSLSRQLKYREVGLGLGLRDIASDSRFAAKLEGGEPD
jgi:hypothetical protein